MTAIPEQVTVWMPSELGTGAFEQSRQRLRSWALIRGARVIGPAFLSFARSRSDATPSEIEVHLPIEAGAEPHPETGLRLRHRPAGEALRMESVAFSNIAQVSREAASQLGSTVELSERWEFHFSDDVLRSGVLYAPVDADRVARPGETRVIDGAA